jgi:hypothetical protein
MSSRTKLPAIAVVAGAALVLWFLLRGGSGGGGNAADTRRCAIRIAPGGITVDGARTTLAAAVDRCRDRGAEIIVTGDAREGDWIALRDALDSAGVPWSRRNHAAGQRA